MYLVCATLGAFCLSTSVSSGVHSDLFWVFLFIWRDRVQTEVEWWPKRAIVLFGGLRLSTQAKRCEMRPHPASKKTEGERARLGREIHVVSKYSENRNRFKSTYLWCYN